MDAGPKYSDTRPMIAKLRSTTSNRWRREQSHTHTLAHTDVPARDVRNSDHHLLDIHFCCPGVGN